MTETQWWRFVEELIGNDNAQEAAARAGFSKSNFTRWKQGARADPDFVVKLVRAYGGSVLDGLVAAGFITRAEASVRIQKQPVSELSDTELAHELLRRAKAREAGFRTADEYEYTLEAISMLGYDDDWLRENLNRQRRLIGAVTTAYRQGERDPERVQSAIDTARATIEAKLEELQLRDPGTVQEKREITFDRMRIQDALEALILENLGYPAGLASYPRQLGQPRTA